MSFSHFQDSWLRLYSSKNFLKIMKLILVGFFRRRFYRIVPPVVFDGLGDHALYLSSSARLCCWNWGSDCGCFRLYDQLLWTPNRWELWISVHPHLFVHNWSLAVEVHYYILWGLAVWFLSKQAKSNGQLKGMVFLLSCCCLLDQLLLYVYW